MRQFLLVLCGIPASGKTILANEIRNHLNQELLVEIVSTDEWRDEVYYSSFNPENEALVRKSALDKTELLLSQGKSVIHDDTNYYTSMRHELYELAKINECIFGVVQIITPLDIALEWNLRREIILPEHVIKRIHHKFDEPGTKYVWDKPITRIDLSELGASQAATEIIYELKKLESVSISEIEVGETIDTLRDKVTRLVIAKFLKDNKDFRDDTEVHRLRKAILHEAKKKGYSAKKTKERLELELSKITRGVS